MSADITPGLERPADDHSILETGQLDESEEIPPSRLGTGSLFQRLTGSLRRVTGSLRDTGSLPTPESNISPEPDQLKRVDSIMTGRLRDDLPLPQESEIPVEPVVFEEAEPIPMPGSRREVPDSGIITASLPALEEEPESGPGAEPDESHPQPEEGRGSSRSGTGSLIQRVTGTLRKVTGSLLDTGGLKPPESQSSHEASQTSQLPEKKRSAGPDYVSDLRKTLTSEEEADRTKRSTGSLMQRITGRLRRITGSLRPTDALPPQEPISTSPETVQPETIQPEIGDDFLTGRLATAPTSELPAIEESPPI
ncbi:MAG: hypothetical protein EHM21_15665, partial [Chloroflexi bacterium]